MYLPSDILLYSVPWHATLGVASMYVSCSLVASAISLGRQRSHSPWTNSKIHLKYIVNFSSHSKTEVVKWLPNEGCLVHGNSKCRCRCVDRRTLRRLRGLLKCFVPVYLYPINFKVKFPRSTDQSTNNGLFDMHVIYLQLTSQKESTSISCAFYIACSAPLCSALLKSIHKYRWLSIFWLKVSEYQSDWDIFVHIFIHYLFYVMFTFIY